MSENHDTFALIGTTVDGRYRIDSVVGEGGFGVVYRGYHLNFKKPIAVKVLKAPGHFTPQARGAFVEKFREEGQMLSQLSDSPGVVRVYDFGVVQSQTMGPAPYLVLEWLDGQTLEAFLEDRRRQGLGPLALAEAVALLAPAIDAVAYAHQRKIAHRDIKPANIFLVQTPRGPALKVLDFGIGKAMQEGESVTFASTGTKSAFHAFSPLYGAPEQFFSKKFGATGPWTDVHALALVLVEMMLGRTALDGDDAAELLVSSTSDARPTPRNRGLAVPDAVEAVFQRALARAPQERLPDAQQFLDALRAALATVGIAIPAAPASAYGNLAALPSATSSGVHAPTGPVARPTGPVEAVGTAAWLASSGMTPGGAGADTSSPQIGIGATMPVQSGGGRATGPSPLGATPVGIVTAQGHSEMAFGAATAPGGVPSALGVSTPAPTAPGSVLAAQGIAAATGFAPPAPGAPGTTNAPWAASDPGAAPTASPAGRKRAAWPWALAGAVVVGGGVAAAVAVFGKGGPGPGPGGSTTTGSDALPAPSADTSALERTVLSRQFALGKSAYPVVPIVEGDGAGKWHARLSYKGDRPVSVQWVRPSGAIASELTFERGADGTETIHSFDGYHVEQWTRVVSPDGVSTTTDRSGVVSSSGCYRVRRTYDAQGNLAEEACLSPTGVPIADSTGCQVRRYGYDERRLQTSDSCLGYDGSGKDVKPAPNANGIHLVKYHYDAEGNRSDEGYFDVMGAAVARISDGCFGVKLEHDAAGNQTGIACVDASGGRRKVMGQQAASSRTEPDANGCSLKITYQDVPGKPATWGLVAFQTWQVDAQCNVLREESRGPDGKPIAPEGTKVAATSYEYDDKGRVTMRRCFGADLAPTNCENTGAQIGVVTRYSHDERGRRTSERYYTADDKPSAQSHSYPHETRTSYGDDGRVSAFAFFDEQGKPAVALGGVARMAYRYDALGGEVSQSYFGASGEPIDSSVGCHELRRSYDERHRIESIECRAASGELKAHANMILHGVTWPAGAARVTVSRGEFIENAFWAPNGNPVSKIDCRSEATPCHR